MVLMHVFDHLVARNPESMKLVGGLAESWKTVDDYTWEFRIRKGVKFQNGEPLDANAVKFNIDRVLDPAENSPLRDRFSGITQVQVIDPYGIRLKTEKPNPVLLERLTNLQLVGRNGMHKYNNQDHSMVTAMLAVRNLFGERYNVWAVNAEAEYHEQFSDPRNVDELMRQAGNLAATQPFVPPPLPTGAAPAAARQAD